MRKSKKTLAILAIIAMVLMMIPVQAFADTTSTNRLAGSDRVDTAIAIANSFATSASTVVVAPADQDNLVDSLAVAPLAYQLGAPILLTYKDSLDARVQAEIGALKATTVYAVGALSDAAVSQLKAISGVTVVQIQGKDRFDTAAQISAKLTSPAGTVVVGYNGLADALSAASFAAANKFAILIADTNGSLPASEAVVGTTTYTVGGQVAAINGATAFAGADRYATNDAAIKGLAFKYDKVFVANGETLVDALAGSVLAAKTQSPIVLANANGAAAATTVSGKMSPDSQVVAFGGSAVVSDSVVGSFSKPTAGAAANVKVSDPTNLVANGKSTETITATIVDANGFKVSNFIGFVKVAFKDSTSNGAVQLANPASGKADGAVGDGAIVENYQVSNGVANIKLVATDKDHANLTDTLAITAYSYSQADGTELDLPTQNVDVNSVEQAATTVKISSASSLSSNSNNNYIKVSSSVVDADGEDLAAGNYAVTFHVSGPAKFGYLKDDPAVLDTDSKTTDDQTIGAVYNGTDAAVETQSDSKAGQLVLVASQGVTGSVTLTATVAGLPTASKTIPVVTAQAPTALSFSTASQTIAEDDTNLLKYTVNLVDANGYLTTKGSDVVVNLKTANKDDKLEFTDADGVDLGATPNNTQVTITAGKSNVSFYVKAMGGKASTVNFTAKDSAGNYTVANGTTVFTPGAYAKIGLSPRSTDANSAPYALTLSAANPNQTFTVQAKDSGSNAVAASKYVAVKVVAADGANNNADSKAKINGVSTDTTPKVFLTDSTGKATFTMSATGYLGDKWVVKVLPISTPSDATNADFTGAGYVYSGVITVAYTVASQVSVSLDKNSVVSGATVTATITAKDASGIEVTGDTFRITTNDTDMTIAADGAAVVDRTKKGDGTYDQGDASHNVYDVDTTGGKTVTITGGDVGTQSFTVKDLFSATNPSVTKSLVTKAGDAYQVIVQTPAGDQKAYGIADGTTIAGPFTLKLVDKAGNAAVYGKDIVLTTADIDDLMTDAANGGVAVFAGIRKTTTGSNVDSLKIVAGTSSVTFYAEVTATGQMVPKADGFTTLP